MQVVVFPDADSLARGAAHRIAGLIRTSAGGTVSLALAGGRTPASTYHHLRAEDVPWRRVFAWIGDERFVGPEHPDNNGAMVQRTLLDGIDVTFAPVPWRAAADPHTLASEYEQTLLGNLDHDAAGPRPDIMLMGMGEDGHTLSLFPQSEALEISDRWYAATWVAAKDTWRLTATLALAHRARHVIFLVAGSGKAAALARVLEPDPDAPLLPAARIMEGEADVTWLVDAAAAGELRATTTVREPASG